MLVVMFLLQGGTLQLMIRSQQHHCHKRTSSIEELA